MAMIPIHLKVDDMSKYQMSLNQLADFRTSSESSRKRLIKQQLVPDKFRIPWYQLTKARVRKSLELKGDLSPVYAGIATLLERKASTPRQVIDKQISLEALERFIEIKMPTYFRELEWTIIKPKVKSTFIAGVEIIVAPDLIVKSCLNGKTVLGGIKIHISKSKPFDLYESRIVATTIEMYLKDEVAEEGVEVLPDLCMSLDIFSGRVVTAKESENSVNREIQDLCEEIKRLWDLP